MARLIDIPREQREPRWLAPLLLGVALACVGTVVLLLLWDTEGPFIGPW